METSNTDTCIHMLE